MEYIIFKLKEKEFGVPIEQVREVLKLSGGARSVTSLPDSPSFIEGIIPLRQHSLAVMNLCKRFKSILSDSAISQESNYVIVVKTGKVILGLLVDRISQLLKIETNQIDPVEKVIDGFSDTKMVAGVTYIGEKIIILLNLNHILNLNEKQEIDGII